MIGILEGMLYLQLFADDNRNFRRFCPFLLPAGISKCISLKLGRVLPGTCSDEICSDEI